MNVIKKIMITDIAIGIVVAVVMWKSIGTEGMAAKFCSLIEVEKCNEIEWSDEYNPEK